MATQRQIAIGTRFDHLTVTGYTADTQGRAEYACRCDCGSTVQRRATLLRRNKTNNCGCAPRGKWKGVGVVSSTFFYRIRNNAEARDIPFHISLEYIAGLYERQRGRCALTGLPISFAKKTAGASTASLDRIDNTRGYEDGNVWWVHTDVNFMKGELPLARFRELCRLVSASTPPRP